MIEKIYYKSDFVALIKLPESIGDNDVRIDLMTTGAEKVTVKRAELYAKGDACAIILRAHGLRPGRLTATLTYQEETEYSDEPITKVLKWQLPVELTRDATDMADSGESGGGSSAPITPPNYELMVSPSAPNITVDQMDVTIIRTPTAIKSYDLSGVRYIKSVFGNVWFDGFGEAELSDDRKELTLTWNIVKGNYPAGTALTLEIPAGAIVLDTGAVNNEYKSPIIIM